MTRGTQKEGRTKEEKKRNACCLAISSAKLAAILHARCGSERVNGRMIEENEENVID